jgi:hypothetical protein
MAFLKAVLRPALAGAGLILLAGCATESAPEQMSVAAGAVSAPAPGSRADHSFRIGEISGEGDSSPIQADVSNSLLHAALAGSLHNLGYLADDPAKAAYSVSADLVDLDRPVVALDPALLLVPMDLSVTARIHYVVKPVAGGRPVFDEDVSTTGTATASDAISPAGRVRKANEAAVRLNTVAFLQRLATDWK